KKDIGFAHEDLHVNSKRQEIYNDLHMQWFTGEGQPGAETEGGEIAQDEEVNPDESEPMVQHGFGMTSDNHFETERKGAEDFFRERTQAQELQDEARKREEAEFQRIVRAEAAEMEQDEQDWIVPEKHDPINKPGGGDVDEQDGWDWSMGHEEHKGEEEHGSR
ncbi:MAG: hypothetical protein ABJK83_00010, partial [Parasphingorhabdus sp.]|uniref:hypothetical protein n=1 Tax=Parasphingorhabdus sp. TaxID=2709688 RepID=UPI0032976584